MRLFWSIYDDFRFVLLGRKAWNSGWIKLARPSEIVNVEVGMTVVGLNRRTGSVILK